MSGVPLIFILFLKHQGLQEPLRAYFVLAAARQGQSSRYLKHEDKLRVSRSVLYLLFEGTLFKQPMASSATWLFMPQV